MAEVAAELSPRPGPASPTRAGATASSSTPTSPTELLHRLTSEALARGETPEDLTVTRPSLEDVYLQLTSTEAEEHEAVAR